MATRLLGRNPCRAFFSSQGKGQIYSASYHTVLRGHPCRCRYGTALTLSSYQSCSSVRSPWSSVVQSRTFLSWIWGGNSASSPDGDDIVSESVAESGETVESVSGYFGDAGAFISPDMTFPDSCATAMWKLDAVSRFEPSFTALGLGGYSPWGLCQWTIEWFHTACGMPWWASVLALAVSVRLLIFPIYVYSQRSAALLNAIQPQMIKLEAKKKFFAADGNLIEERKAEEEIGKLMKKEGAPAWKGSLALIFQAPFFIGGIFGLRRAAALPVRSMQDGGLFWFKDLTVPDPYYILPVLAGASQFVMLWLRAEMSALTPMALQFRKYSWVMCIILCGMLSQWPSDLVLYWSLTNLVGVAQSRITKLPSFRKRFKFPKGEEEAEKLLLSRGKANTGSFMAPFKDFQMEIDKKSTFRYQMRQLRRKEKEYDKVLRLSRQGKGRIYD